VAREAAAAAGNDPVGGYDVEAQIHDAINLSRVEAEFQQGVEGRGGTYERGGGSGWRGLDPFQRMLRRAGSRRDTPVVVEDYNLVAGGRSGMTQTRIDTGSWTQKGKMQGNLLEKLGPNSSILREYLGDRRIVLTLLVRLERHRSGVSFLSFYVHESFLPPCVCVYVLMFFAWL
jgi:hypothetical protein